MVNFWRKNTFEYTQHGWLSETQEQGQQISFAHTEEDVDGADLTRDEGHRIRRRRGHLRRRFHPTPHRLLGRASTLRWTPSPPAGAWLRRSRTAPCGPPSAHSTTSYTERTLHWRPEKCWVSCFKEIGRAHEQLWINLLLCSFRSILDIPPVSPKHNIVNLHFPSVLQNY